MPIPVADLCEPARTAGRSAMPGPRSRTTTTKLCGGGSPRQAELDVAAARVFIGVAGDLRDRGGDARLVLRVEADQFGQPARPAADQHDVRLGGDRDPQQAGVHGATLRRGSHRDHRGVVAAAPVVAQQHAGDQRGMLAGEPGIGGRDPSGWSARRSAGSPADRR